jgi:hypothetical protein
VRYAVVRMTQSVAGLQYLDGRKARWAPAAAAGRRHRALAHAVNSSQANATRHYPFLLVHGSPRRDCASRLDDFLAVIASIRGLDCSLAAVTMRTAFMEAGGIVKSCSY